jgi:hypothetical protein
MEHQEMKKTISLRMQIDKLMKKHFMQQLLKHIIKKSFLTYDYYLREREKEQNINFINFLI